MSSLPASETTIAAHYRHGFTPVFASQYDQRFSFGLYVPPSFATQQARPLRVLVAVHGTGRNIHAYRTAFRDFADAHHCLILCPLFPAGIDQPGDLDGYKFLRYCGVQYDTVLLAMLEEIAEIYPLQKERFMLFGFSGGAHFAHRFLYVNPQRLSAVAVDAPGIVTLLDRRRDWPAGVRDFATRFGSPPDIEAIRRVPVHLIVGAEDTETWEMTVEPGSPWWVEGINDSGVTRVDRLQSLRASLQQAGVAVSISVVAGKGHEPLVEPAKSFFQSCVR